MLGDGQGTNEWSLAYACFMFSAVLQLLRTEIPDWAGVFGSAALLMAGYVLLLAGISKFTDQPATLIRVAVPWLIGCLWSALDLWVTQRYFLQPIGIAAIEFWICFAIARLLHERMQEHRSFGATVLLFGLGIDCLFSMLLAFFSASYGENYVFGNSDALHSAIQLFHSAILAIWALALVTMVNEKKCCEWELLATYDSLTGAHSRGAFIQTARTEIVRAKRNGRRPSFLLIDLDNFKRVNDSCGHDVGDELLRSFAELAQKLIRPHDIFARYGGEEFIVMMPETSEAAAACVAERFRAAAEGIVVPSADKSFGITISIGVSEVHGDDESLESAIQRADRSLYRAKRSGRNRVECASAQLSIEDPVGVL